ncbi:GL15341 [Drosophila persimilis]|uniref:GL15341 n=1 Tax=Drosophila persimilis TaxID=7234 RepID=B4HCU6_DROPE|nr:GL15341 [Drosophila persimilis]
MFHFLTRKIRQAIGLQPYRPLYYLLYGQESEDEAWLKPVRYLGRFVVGLVLAYLLWALVALNFNLNRWFAHIPMRFSVFEVFMLLNGVAFTLLRSVRAVTMLIFVGLVGKSGRTYLRAIAFAFVIAGPIDNLALNAAEVARVFACTTVLTYNLTKTRFDLMARPFTNTLQHMRGDMAEVRNAFQELEDVLIDLKYAVEESPDEEESGQSGQSDQSELPTAEATRENFLHNMRIRCEQQLSSGIRVCEEVFREGYDKCSTNFPDFMAPAICWPYRVDIVCRLNVFGSPEKPHPPRSSRTVILPPCCSSSLELITAGLFLLLDHMVVSLMQIIRQRSLVTYQQRASTRSRFHINGTGLMARLLRITMRKL